MKLITARMIRSKGSCYNPTELDGVDSKTKWTLLEWMNYKHYKGGVRDAIWVFCHLADERMAREFAIWCARRCKTDCRETKDYLDAIEGYYLNGTHTKEQMTAAWSAYLAAGRAGDVAAYWAAYRAAYAANWAAYWAGDVAAYWAAADMAAYWASERKAQFAKIKRMLKEAK